MRRMIRIRNVPDAVHRTLKARAAMAGMSLSDYLLVQIRDIAKRPTLEELTERIRRREPVNLPFSAAEVTRAQRGPLKLRGRRESFCDRGWRSHQAIMLMSK